MCKFTFIFYQFYLKIYIMPTVCNFYGVIFSKLKQEIMQFKVFVENIIIDVKGVINVRNCHYGSKKALTVH